MKKNKLLFCALSLFFFSCKGFLIPSGDSIAVEKSKETEKETENQTEKETENQTEKETENNEIILENEKNVEKINKEKTENENTEQKEQFVSDDEEKQEKSETEKENETQMKEIDAPGEVEIEERKWTILVYMAADNNLEASAMEDIYEMESSKLNTDAVTVLLLVDRTPAFDTTCDNWDNTRLYKLKTGREGKSKKMISEEIECKDLDLHAQKDTEIDMASDYVLSSFISYACKRFPAEHFGLIMWGHGTGWRSENQNLENSDMLYKGFAYDDTSKTYMTLHQLSYGLKNGLNNRKLDFIGFDTCFGGEIEVMYEIRNFADYGIGSEGLLMSSGWNYEALFNDFQQKKDYSVVAFTDSVVEQFKNQYLHSYRASIAVVNLQKISSMFQAFDGFCDNLAALITTAKDRDNVMGILYSNDNCKTEKYSYGTVGNDIYLDIYSMIENLYSGNKKKKSVKELYDVFVEEEKSAVVNSWASDRTKGSLGVYFSTIVEGNLLSVNHPAAYIKENVIEQIDFVLSSNGYVPTVKHTGSLLDKLFYTSF